MKYTWWEAFDLHDIVAGCYTCKDKSHKDKLCLCCNEDIVNQIMSRLQVDDDYPVSSKELKQMMDDYCE